MKEFNWLGDCTSCNIYCCHNTDKNIPQNQCIRPDAEKRYATSGNTLPPGDSINNISMNKPDIKESYDYRPLECRLFPFDVKEIDGKLVWVKWNNCHATPKLDYEKFMGFFEKKFSRELSLDDIKKYVLSQKSKTPETLSQKEFIIIKEINWPYL
jgi:hypothetical protein